MARMIKVPEDEWEQVVRVVRQMEDLEKKIGLSRMGEEMQDAFHEKVRERAAILAGSLMPDVSKESMVEAISASIDASIDVGEVERNIAENISEWVKAQIDAKQIAQEVAKELVENGDIDVGLVEDQLCGELQDRLTVEVRFQKEESWPS